MTTDSKRKTALPDPPKPEPGNASADDLLVSRAIVRLAEAGSFSAAARSLGVSVSAISRALQRHEQRLGVALFLRSTHGLSPTVAGRRYAEHLRSWLREEDAMRAMLNAQRRAESGSLRITVPVYVAEQLLAKALRVFAEAYPQVTLDIHASDDVRDLIKEGFDLAIRLGAQPASNLRSRTVAGFRRWVVASPALLAHSRPSEPAALREAPCLLLGSGLQEQTWEFWSRDGEHIEVKVEERLRSSNVELLHQLCCAGVGIARLPDGVVNSAIERGALVQLFPEYTCTPANTRPAVYAVHAKDPGKDRLRDAFVRILQETTSEQRAQLDREEASRAAKSL